VSLLSFGYGAYAAAQALVFHRAVTGWASLAVLISFLSGVQLLTLGLFGEYLGQVLDETRGRPLYVVAETSLHQAEGMRDTASQEEPSRGRRA
jgi:dolichol-phosphate mannosyltransferase